MDKNARKEYIKQFYTSYSLDETEFWDEVSELFEVDEIKKMRQDVRQGVKPEKESASLVVAYKGTIKI